MRNSGLLGVVIAVAIVALFAGLQFEKKTETRSTGPTISANGIAQLYSSSFRDTAGQAHSLSKWRGKILVVNFWAAWCPPCREEMPAFSRLQTKYSSKNVQFVGIALDNADNVMNFAKTQPVDYPLFLAEAEGPELLRQLGNSQLALPYTIVFSGNGSALLVRLGRIGEQELEELLKSEAATQ